MTILTFDENIASKTTYHVPVLFGDPKYDDRKLFSYSIYEDKIVKEVRFAEKEVVIWHFDQSNFLSLIETYNESNQLLKTKIEFIEKTDGKFIFRDWTPGNGDGNHGTLSFVNGRQNCELNFHRVDSFLGYHIKGVFKCNELGLFVEEKYYQWDLGQKEYIFAKMVVNEYTMKEHQIDKVARKVLADGWFANKEALKEISI